MNVLITGGAGYIGSHIALSLLQKNHRVIVLDNLCNSSPLALTRVEALSGKKMTFHQGDIRRRADLNLVFSHQPIDAVIHMAGLKSVNESLQKPLKYYQKQYCRNANAAGNHEAASGEKTYFQLIRHGLWHSGKDSAV